MWVITVGAHTKLNLSSKSHTNKKKLDAFHQVKADIVPSPQCSRTNKKCQFEFRVPIKEGQGKKKS